MARLPRRRRRGVRLHEDDGQPVRAAGVLGPDLLLLVVRKVLEVREQPGAEEQAEAAGEAPAGGDAD